jgi:glucosamine--fructose-6-phosphate aminotransferase (isomerizing)
MTARQSDSVLYTHAGPEIGVASTKAFTTQLAAFYLLALQLGSWRGVLSTEELQHYGQQLARIPDQLERTLEQDQDIRKLAERFDDARNFLYLGRGLSFPIALEGALKLKEISYVHAEGYSAGEMKHGPIALISKEMPVVVLAPCDPLYRKTMGNIEEVRVRDGKVLVIATEGDSDILRVADHAVFIPPTNATLHPLLSVVPLQLFAYHAAALRGCDIDKPRNLAKSVTVE